MQALESLFSNLASSSAGSLWLGLYYALLLFLLGALFLALMMRRILPLVAWAAGEELQASVVRRIRALWVLVTLLGPVHVFCRVEGFTDNIIYRLSGSAFFFGLVYVATEIVLLLLIQGLFRRVLNVPISAIFKDLLRLVIYILALVSIVRVMFGIEDVGTLVAVSSAASIIVGLALQDTLGNIFAGLFLQMDSPVNLNDWVQIEGEEGLVVEMTWYSTRLVTRENQLVSIPNQRVGKAIIKNFTRPTQPMMVRKRVGVHYSCAPNRVKDVLRRHLAQVPGVLAQPAPDVFLVEFGDSSVNYELRFWISDLRRISAISDAAMTGVWYHLKRAEMEIPFPIRTVILQRPTKAEGSLHRVIQVLCKVDFLAALEPSELESIAGDLKQVLYTRNERIYSQGDPGDTFSIIWSGAVSVKARRGEEEVAVATLKRGDYFGEMSMLTGEPRVATVDALEDTVLLTLDRTAFGFLLARNPGMAEQMSHIIAHRLAATQTRLAEHEKDTLSRQRAGAEEASIYGRLMAGIKTMFGV